MKITIFITITGLLYLEMTVVVKLAGLLGTCPVRCGAQYTAEAVRPTIDEVCMAL